MNRGYGGYQPDNRKRSHGHRGGNRSNSYSSGSSDGRRSQKRPTLKSSLAPQGHVLSSDPLNQAPAGVDSPLIPALSESTLTLNGRQINETHTTRPKASTSQSQISMPPSPARGENRICNSSGGQLTTQRPVTRVDDKNWAYYQEEKIKLCGMPKSSWSIDVYNALLPYGTVVRIDMQPGSLDNNAYVTFQ